MKITPVINNLYVSDAITDWGRVRALGPDLIIGVGGLHKTGLEPYDGPIQLNWHFDDANRYPDSTKLNCIVDWACDILDKGGRVLIHDKDGKNRVWLVAGLVMRAMGWGRWREILGKITAIEPKALTNSMFRTYLANYVPSEEHY